MTYVLKEMMFGSRETFEYERCRHCGCLQIADVPVDLARHYPDNYYSMLPRHQSLERTGFKKLIAEWYCRSAVLKPDSLIAHVSRRLLPMPTEFAEVGKYLIESHLNSELVKILDVGCGASPYLLAAIKRCGFKSVYGIDPNIPADLIYQGVSVARRTIEEMPDDQFGLIMFHHSLEHVSDPIRTLRHAARLIPVGGTCLVRVPVMGTYFWQRFGENWVELDPPRHLYCFSVESINALAEQTGFSVRKIVFDSRAWEIAASIRYEKGIPLLSPQSITDGFSQFELEQFEQQVEQLNAQEDAGRACFYLERQ